MAINIEVRVDHESTNEAVERARVLDRSITEAITQLGQSAVTAVAALSIGGEIARSFREAVTESARQELGFRTLIRAWYDNRGERGIAGEARYRTPIICSNDEVGLTRRNHCNCSDCLRERERYGYPDIQRVQEEESSTRACTLLLSCLSPGQRKEFEDTDLYFTVTAPSQRRYRIEKGFNWNIKVLGDDGKVIGKLCAGPTELVPVYDSMLSQKLWLENDEEGFLRIANRDKFRPDSERGGPVFFGVDRAGMDLPISASTIRYDNRGPR